MLDSLLELACSQTEAINHVEPEEIRAWPASENARDVILGPQEALYCSNEACCTCGQDGLRREDAAAECRRCGHLVCTNWCIIWQDQLGVLCRCCLGARNPTTEASTSSKVSAPPESRAARSAAIATQAAQRVKAAVNVVTRGPAARAIACLSLPRKAGATEAIVYEDPDTTELVPARDHAEPHANMIAVLLAIVLVLAMIWFRTCRIVRIHLHLPFVSLEMERRHGRVPDAELVEIESEDDLVFHDADIADTWTCAACTYINEAGVEACEMCDAQRGEPVLPPANADEPEALPPAPPPGAPPNPVPAPMALQGSWGPGQHAQRRRLVEESKRVPCPTCGGFRRKTAGSNSYFIRVGCDCGTLLRRERVLSHAEVRGP